MEKKRTVTFDYSNLSTIGKISFRMSAFNVTSKLISGNWLDILCGYKSLLQASQINNPKISSFCSLDHKLDKKLLNLGINLKELYIKKKLPYGNNYFDNISIINGLEHLWFPQEILSECYRILKTGGVLQVIVPTWFGKPFLELLAFTVKNKSAAVEMDDHKMYYDEKTLWALLVQAGFKPSKIKIKRIKFYCSLHSIVTK